MMGRSRRNRSFGQRVGAAHKPEFDDGRHRMVSYDSAPGDVPRAELAHWDEYAFIDDGELSKDALDRLLRNLIDGLDEPQRTCVQVFFFDARGVAGQVQQGVDSGFREAARIIGTNPVSGKRIDKKTVQKYVNVGVGELREQMLNLPDWLRDLVARHLVEGAFPEPSELSADGGLPHDFPTGLSSGVGR